MTISALLGSVGMIRFPIRILNDRLVITSLLPLLTLSMCCAILSLEGLVVIVSGLLGAGMGLLQGLSISEIFIQNIPI